MSCFGDPMLNSSWKVQTAWQQGSGQTGIDYGKRWNNWNQCSLDSATLQNARIAEHKNRENFSFCLQKHRNTILVCIQKQLANYTNWSAMKSFVAGTNLGLIFRCFFTNFTQNCVFSFILPMICLGGKRHYSSILQTYRNLPSLAGKSIGWNRHVIEFNQS